MLSLGVAALALAASSARADFLFSITEGPQGTLTFSSNDPSVPASSFMYSYNFGYDYTVTEAAGYYYGELVPTWTLPGNSLVLYTANDLVEVIGQANQYGNGNFYALIADGLGLPGSGTSVTYVDAWTDSQGNMVDFTFNGLAVPEPSTPIAGVLTLLPFGASTVRVLRKRISA